jgi:small subunit ribosomal protein S15
MPRRKKDKGKIISEFKTHEQDSGSVEVQVGILTKEIKELTEHLKTHKHDFSSRRGLLRKVSKRKKLLRYLEQTNPKSYEKIIKKIKG